MAVLLVIAILCIDQAIKIWVKTSMSLSESIHITDWFYINFIENNGMAYGMQIGSKLALSLFRVAAIGVLSWYIWQQVRKPGTRWGYIVFLTMVLAGAAGNLIDCMFYGLCFSPSSYYDVSQYVGFGNGYAPFLMGKVVDMFYFPLIETTYPDWFPFYGGERFVFFSPVFNFADASISVGVVALLLFYRKEIGNLSFKKETKDESQSLEKETKEEDGENSSVDA
jgi:signal peptidase II